MKYEKVMENYPKVSILSKKVLLPNGLFIAICLISLIVFSYLSNSSIEHLLNPEMITIFLLLFVLLTFALAIKSRKKIEKETYINWINDYVIPYIKSLPIQREENLNSVQVEGNQGIVKFIVNGELKNEKAKLKFEEDLSKPYVTFVINTHDFDGSYYLNLSKEYKKDEIYFVTLHLPIDYKL